MRKKSILEHRLTGTFRPSRHTTPAGYLAGLKSKAVPRFTPGATAPKYLSKVAKQEWKRVAPLLAEQGILADVDTTTLAAYCVNFAGWLEAIELVQKQGMVIIVSSQTRTGRTDKPIRNPAVSLLHSFEKAMLQSASKLGLNPADRPKIEVPSADDIADEVARSNSPFDRDLKDCSMPEEAE